MHSGIFLRLPFLTLFIWIGLVAAGFWLATQGAGEPPFWDALSYAEKSRLFWENITAGKWVDPFTIERTIRPPGVIPISYPFGYSPDYHPFYFRWLFLPIVLLTAAVWVSRQNAGRAANIAVISLALVLAGMPLLYQFQPNHFLRSQSNWGLVDATMAGIVAFATAAAMRSIHQRSVGWAAVAALVASYGLLIKPSGLILMFLVGGVWVALTAASVRWNPRVLRDDSGFRRYALRSFGLAAAIYAVVLIAAFTSPYYSPENIQFGVRNLEIFDKEVVYDIDLSLIALLWRHSLGWPVLAVLIFGFGTAMVTRHYANAALAAFCFIVGIWFWIFTTNVGDVRYVVPFVTLTFILLVPPILALVEQAPRITSATVAITAVPTLAITALLLMPAPPLAAQAALGVNLLTNVYAAENAQARALLNDLARRNVAEAEIYIFDVNTPIRNIGSVIDYHNVMERRAPYLRTILAVDWSRGLTFRCDEMVKSEFLAFEPVNDAEYRDGILDERRIADYPAQARLMSAWASTLGPAQGVEIVSETRVRIVRVVDPARFARALQAFTVGYQWPEPFRIANAAVWWSPTARAQSELPGAGGVP